MTAPASQPQTTSQPTGLTIDVNLARLAVVLGDAGLYRLWELRRIADPDGQAHTTLDQLYNACQQYGVTMARATLADYLREGDGLYWNYNSARATVNYAGFSARNLSTRLVQRVLDGFPTDAQLHTANRPGGGLARVVVPFGGNSSQFEAFIYAGWIAAHNGVKISRIRLEKLFNTPAGTLRRWEKTYLQDVVNVAFDYHTVDAVEYASSASPETVFPHDQYYVDRDGNYTYQGTNTYTANLEHASTYGQSRRIRSAVDAVIDPDGIMHVGERRYFDSDKRYIAHVKRHGMEGNLSVFKTWREHTNRYTGKRVKINRYNQRIIVDWKQGTHVTRVNFEPNSKNETPIMLLPDAHAQPTRNPAHDTPAHAHAQPSPVTHDQQRRKPTTQADVLKRDNGHELYTLKSRIRIHPTGAILCQPENVGTINPDTLPDAVKLIRWEGELWLRCLHPERTTRNALIALCPDLKTVFSDIGATMLDIAVARRHSHLRSTWDTKNNQNNVHSVAS